MVLINSCNKSTQSLYYMPLCGYSADSLRWTNQYFTLRISILLAVVGREVLAVCLFCFKFNM